MVGGRFLAARRVAASLAVSAALVALLYRLATRADATPEGAGLGETLRGIQLPLVGGYLLAQLTQTVLRAWRYRLLLRGSGEPSLPGLLPLTLVTAARNMFVDMLPARIGELSYAALLTRRYGVRLAAAVSSLGLAVFLDVAALLGVLAALLAAGTAGAARGGLPGTAAMLAALVLVLAWAVFRGPRLFVALVGRLPARLRERPLPARAIGLLVSVAADVDAVRGSGALPGALALSVGVRFCKYAGLYAAFLAVTESSFGRLYRAPAREVLAALIAGEGAAAVPVPSFMSFGTYEAGGLAALAAFGYPASQVLAAFLALHLVSQAIDYGLGGLGLIGIAWSGGASAPAPGPATARRRVLAVAAALVAAAFVVAGSLLWRRHEQQRRGLALAPPPGVAAPDDPALRGRLEALLDGRRGFVVWSSNRHGTHDILRLDLPGGEITRLTAEPHADTYPRISPDGASVVFSRSQPPWVSQRDPVPWDAWIVDAAGGSERLVARGAASPSWSADGARVFFQRDGGQFVEHRLDGGAERVLFSAGVPPVPAGVQLQSPDYDEAAGRLVATLRGRGAPRITALFEHGGAMRQLGGAGDCQVAWSPDRRSVFFVGHGGRQQNALYTLVPGARPELWLDLPGDLSHEYFPRQSADGRFVVFAASAGGSQHEHDAGDYEIFLWRVGDPAGAAVRLTHHTGNDAWPDVHLFPE